MLFIIFLSLPFFTFCQKPTERQIINFINSVSNKQMVYGVTSYNLFSDSTLKSTSRTVKIKDNKQRLFIEKYKDELYPYLIAVFDDPKKDWAVNVIFYAITKKNASAIEYMTEKNIEHWRNAKKSIDKEYWISTFKNAP